MKKPVVSVVIPNYNYGHFLRACIDSVLDQTYRDWEILVVDDNSTDNSRKIVESYAERYPDRQIWLFVNPRGPSGTPTPINIGIEHMRGKYFAWLSSDDIFEKGKLEAQVRFMEAKPSVGLVHTAYTTIDGSGRQIGDFHPPSEFETDAFTALLDGNFINGNTVLIRREVLEDVGLFLETDDDFPELWRAAEYYHWLKIALRYPIACLEPSLHRTRRHEGNAEFNNGSMGPVLERMFIGRCFEENKVPATPEIAAAVGGRGLLSTFVQVFSRLTPPEQVRALKLFREIESDQDCWDLGRYEEVRKLDLARIRSAFHTRNPAQSRLMLEALARLERPQARPYQAAASARLGRSA